MWMIFRLIDSFIRSRPCRVTSGNGTMQLSTTYLQPSGSSRSPALLTLRACCPVGHTVDLHPMRLVIALSDVTLAALPGKVSLPCIDGNYILAFSY